MVKPQLSLVLRVLAGALAVLALISMISVAASAVVIPACGLCHRQPEFVKATEASAHGEIGCSECHGQSGIVASTSFGFQQVLHVSKWLGASAAQSSVTVGDARCLSCHSTINDQVTQSRGLSIAHETCAKGSACTDCHSSTAHGAQTTWVRSYNMDTCLHCHGQSEEPIECTTCHSERRASERIATGPWVVTHGPNWRSTHGMGDMFTCSACHPSGYCDKCHGPGLPHKGDFVQTHPAPAQDPKANCTSCHAKTFCSDCHGIEMPHPVGFKKQHSKIAEKNDAGCKTCHSDSDCLECHLMHVHPGGAVN